MSERALWEHPMLDELFRRPESRRLDSVLLELGEYGSPALGGHDDQPGADGRMRQDYSCALYWRNNVLEPTIASGNTPGEAALRCLLEVLYTRQEQVRKAMGARKSLQPGGWVLDELPPLDLD